MIPILVDIGATWRVLPPGIHDATFREVEQAFAKNQRRKELYHGLIRGCQSLETAGCKFVFLDGSFVTEKSLPGDFDVCWDPVGVDPTKLDPTLLDFTNRRRAQRMKYGGEFFPSSALADNYRTFVDYFQTDKETNLEKGIIQIQLK